MSSWGGSKDRGRRASRSRSATGVAVLLFPCFLPLQADVLSNLERDVSVAQREIEAARSGAFYFVLDVPGKKLSLSLKGLELQVFELQDVEVGRLIGGGADDAWGRAVHDFQLAATRQVQEMTPGQPTTTAIPTETPQQDALMPDSFGIVCDSRLSVLFVPASGRSLWHSLTDRFRRAGEPASSVRLRVEMAEPQYRSLYQAIPQKGKLIPILPKTLE